MADRDDVPTDLFDVVCRLDDLADWLEPAGYVDEAEGARRLSDALKGYIVLSLPVEQRTDEPEADPAVGQPANFPT